MAAPAPPAREDPAVYRKTVEPFLARHCLACHNAKLKTANLNLDAYHDFKAAVKAPEIWEGVSQKLRTGQMPPKGLPRPPANEIAAVTHWIDTLLDGTPGSRKPDPGRLTAHHLNRFEYNNTIHDLLGVDFRPADDFPADDSGYGFDNIGDVLSLSPVLMEKYLGAAEKIARMAIVADPPPKPTMERYKADKLEQVGPTFRTKHSFPLDGEYEIRVSLAGRRPAGGVQLMKVAMWLDHDPAKLVEAEIEREKPRFFEIRVPVKAGDREVKTVVVDDGFNTGDPVARGQDRAVYVDYLDIKGPFLPDPLPLTESHKRIFICGHLNGQHQPGCARLILGNVARRAWRRPVSDAEVDSLTRFVTMAQQEGDSFEKGVRVALEAVLVSPHFLYRIERDPNPTDPKAVHPVSDFELASRISYFLWGSLPDEELFRAAQEGTLRKPEVLTAQVRRMLQDPKSNRLAENFAGQWLQLRNLDSVKPDPDRFPFFDDDLRNAMRTETEMFFESIMHEDRSILDFIDAKYTFLNGRLARLYGIEDVDGRKFRRVDLKGDQRSGVLTQASVLTVTSYPNRTSPVLRGKFLLENILNDPPPPPPPDAGILDESKVNLNGTVRQQFEQHRSQPACNSCHARMDPLGFAFENYDAIGQWRFREGKFRVDASGTLPDGKSFKGAAELKAILMTEKDAFARCLADKMLTYALGRGLERYDRPAVEEISRKTAGHDYRFSSMIEAIVSSMPFRMGRGDGGKR